MTDLDTLLTRYADEPSRLTPDERARVEAWLAEAEVDEATVAVARAAAPAVTPPDWNQLARSIAAATTGARRRWPMAVGAAALVAAAAVALVLARAPRVPLDWTAAATVVDDAVTDEAAVDALLAPVDELSGMGAIDDVLIDEVAAHDGVDDERLDDDLPAIGATWTVWLDGLSDDELDRALRWLEHEEAT